MGTIKFDNVTKMFGETAAIKNFTLEIREEEFFVLVGPSGAGKTTTLKTVAGIHQPDEGRLYIDGKLSNLVPPNERNVSMTFESYALYPHISVYDNIANSLRSPKYLKPESEVDKDVKRIAGMLEIGHLLDRRPGELSGGQKQRVSLGRAMVRRPTAFLLDEPLSHVDAKVRHRMRVELNRLQRELNTTTIYVTHDYVEGLSLGDRVGVIKEGQIVQVDTPDVIYHKPMNEFVAMHIGFPEVNIVSTSVRTHEGSTTLVVDDIGTISFRLAPEQVSLLKEKTSAGRVRVGFRPQAVKLGKDGPGSFKGTVYAFNPFVTYGILILEVEGRRFRVLTQANEHFELGQTVSAGIDAKDVYLFEESTTTNLVYL